MRTFRHRQCGLTLVELVAVLAILGIVIALALPRYLGNRRQAYKDEAYGLLEEVKALEWSYYQEHSAFGASLSSVGFVMPGGSHWGAPSLSVLSGGGNNQGGNNQGGNNQGGNNQGGNNQGGNNQGGNNQGGNNNTLPSVMITVSGVLSPLRGTDQVSLTLYFDGSASSGSSF